MMKPLNWIVLGLSLVFSIFFLWLYFLLGFNLIDWPSGLVFAVLWWLVIIGVVAGLIAQKHHFAKHTEAQQKSSDDQSETVPTATTSTTTTKRTSQQVSVASVVVVALLVPALVFSPYFPTDLSYADTSNNGNQATTSTTDATEQSGEDAQADASQNASTESTSSTPAATDAQTSPVPATTTQAANTFYYKLSDNSQGVDLYYSINGASLQKLAAGSSFSAGYWDKVEFFVRPQVGYMTTSSFLHSGAPDGFVAPNKNGTYSRIGTNELPGFSAALEQALSLGCTKEFHYSNNPSNVRYRQFQISIQPLAVTAVFDLDGGTLNGAATYQDSNTYYGMGVAGHQGQNVIMVPAQTPVKEGYTFAGWLVANSGVAQPAGAQVEIDNYWRYIYDNTTTSGAVLPLTASWIAQPTQVVPPETGITPGESNGSTSTDTPSTAPEQTPSSPDNTGSGNTGGADNTGTSNGSGSTYQPMGPQDPSTNGTASSEQGSASSPADDAQATAATTAALGGDKEHALEIARQQWNVGVVPSDTPMAQVIEPAVNGLRDGLYMVEEIVSDAPVAASNGLSYANRGCWICDYMILGSILTLLYGGGVLILRAARNRKTQR